MSLAPIKSWLRCRTDVFGRIATWQRFAREVRVGNETLLKCLPDYTNPILVAGCQRSGTTAVSRLLTQSEGLASFWSRKDEELDAAVILSGVEQIDTAPRYCFQTTYLNERYLEYFNHIGRYKLVWLLRNPHSVIHSILHNWESFAFEELYEACGGDWMEENRQALSAEYPSDVEKACAAYNGKLGQMYELFDQLGGSNMLVLDYDNLVAQKCDVLPMMYQFLALEYKEEYSQRINAGSVNKADSLSEMERKTIDRMCIAGYEKARLEFSINSRH